MRVTCGPPAAGGIVAGFGDADAAGTNIGLLNTQRFAPGTILQLVPDGREAGRMSVPYLLRVADSDFVARRPEYWLGNVMDANFKIEVDPDIEHAARAQQVELRAMLIRHTKVLALGAWRETLRNPVGLVNADDRVVAIIRAASATSRFVVVSAVSYGSGLRVAYAELPGLPDVLRLRGFYLHLSYSCPAETGTGPGDHRSHEEGMPLIFFYIPLAYDSISGEVRIDERPLDLARFGAPEQVR